MSNEKLKSENYSNFGGINSKVTPYENGPMEFLNLINLDFQTPGALTARWGSTQYVGQTFPGQITALYEYVKLNGASYVMIGHTGGLWAGATTGNSQGLSFATNATFIDTFIVPYAGYQKLPPSSTKSYHSVNSLNTYFQGNTGILIIGNPVGSGATFIAPGMKQNLNVIDFVTFQDNLFGADGDKFFKYNGISTYSVGLPPIVNATMNAQISLTLLSGYSGLYFGVSTAEYVFYGSWVNNRGFEGPIWPIAALSTGIVGTSLTALAGGSYILSAMTVNSPQGYGISSVNIYYFASASLVVSGGDTTFYTNLIPDVTNYHYQLYGNFAVGSTIILGTTSGGQSLLSQNLVGQLPQQPQYSIPGITAIETNGLFSEVDIINRYPRFIEIFGNRLYSSGVSTSPSTVYFSDIAEPEGYFSINNFEVRTNDGDFVTCLKAYNTKLYIFKKNSFYALYGDNPANFFLQEITTEYGCLNNRCCVIYDDVLLFLDRKGVVMFDGAGHQVISTKVQPIFDTMNFTAALTEATMVHDKIRNQILISIPTNGSTTNNLTVVYDYLVGAWTKYDSLSISSLQSIQGRNTTKNTFYGSYSGSVNWFGSSFLSDNGTGFTTLIKSRFIKPLGDSIQEMFRRLYLNTDQTAVTLSFNINFLQDYGSSFVLQTTLVMSQFQQRIDFGISSKSLAFEIANIQSNVRLRVYGFTVESRLQRRV